MKNFPSRFDTLANLLFVENEITPETMALKEDSFKDAAQGYTPEQWMALPYRKRRYITLRDRAKATSGAPVAKPVTPTTSMKVPPPVDELPADDEAPVDLDGDGEDDDVDTDLPDEVPPIEEPTEPVSPEFVDAAVNHVTTNHGTTREGLYNFLSQTYGDRLNTDGEVNRVIRQAVQEGGIEFNAEDVAFIPGSEAASQADPTDADIAGVEDTDTRKTAERQRLIKKFLSWRAQRQAGAPASGEEEDEGEEEEKEDDDVSPMTKADTAMSRNVGSRLKRTGIEDPEAASSD